MAVCDLCKGTGRLLKPWYDTTGLMTGFTGDICFKCDGKGTIGEPMTNEEWFCALPTEEKAEWLTEFAIKFIPCELTVPPKKIKTYKNNIIEWLKEEHDG